MSFTTLTFWVFFAFVLITYWFLRERRWQNGLLVLASYLFYGWVTPRLAMMLGISTLIDFSLARGMTRKAGAHPPVHNIKSRAQFGRAGILQIFQFFRR